MDLKQKFLLIVVATVVLAQEKPAMYVVVQDYPIAHKMVICVKGLVRLARELEKETKIKF